MNFFSNGKSNFRYFIVSFAILFTLSFLVLFFIEKEIQSSKLREIEHNEKNIIKLQNDFLGREFSTILSDLHYLHHAFEKQLENPENYDIVAKNWKEFSNHKEIYDQVRFIDDNGDEKVRINFENKRAYIVAEDKLQNKKDRYYFYETINLSEEVVNVSKLDLNIENNIIEKPYKPMMRFSTPLYDDNGKKMGIIVLNYLADNLLKNFRELAKNSSGEMMLLNSEGYSVSSDNPENDWNFMFEDRKKKSFANDYPKEWSIIELEDGQIVSKSGIFTFKEVDLRHKFSSVSLDSNDENIYLTDGNWNIVSIVDKDSDKAFYFLSNPLALAVFVLKKNIVYFIILTAVSTIMGFLMHVNRKTYDTIKYYSEYDALTNIYNRRAGIDKLNLIIPLTERRHAMVSLCFIDINGLKQVNDTLGHKYGDELISTVADIIKSIIREHDFVMRLGGDEFLIVFNGIGIDIAESVWERIVKAYEYINDNENRPYIISVSHGIIDYDNKQPYNVDELISKADEKMYLEKQIIKASLNVIRYEVENE